LIANGLHVVTIDIWAFVPLWHRGFYPVIGEINFKISVARRWQFSLPWFLLQIICHLILKVQKAKIG